MQSSFKVVYSDDFLAHHGIKGQKWGVRRYQNEDGSLTPEGKRLYTKNRNGEYVRRSNYEASKTRQLKETDKAAYEKSKELDQKINEHRNSLTRGQKFAREIMIGNAGSKLTYDMARASGYGVARSWIKAKFDLSVADLVEAAGYSLGAGITGTRTPTAQTIGKITGTVAGRAAAKGYTDSGVELSLRQRSLRNKYISGNTPNDKRKK